MHILHTFQFKYIVKDRFLRFFSFLHPYMRVSFHNNRSIMLDRKKTSDKQ